MASKEFWIGGSVAAMPSFHHFYIRNGYFRPRTVPTKIQQRELHPVSGSARDTCHRTPWPR